MKYIAVVFCLVSFMACKEVSESLSSEEIVSRAIDNACTGNCSNAKIQFDFRDKHYRSSRDNGYYEFERSFVDSIGRIRDVLTNTGLVRFVNDSLVVIPDSMAVKYANSVNSVHYFAQLPYGLKDPAVNLKLQGEANIREREYYEIGVHFDEENGGDDFEDVYVYWIDKENFKVDYLAYSYATDGGGMRFREAFNERVVEGIRFVDYNNFKPKSLDIALTDLDDLFQKGELELLSRIQLENISVQVNSQ